MKKVKQLMFCSLAAALFVLIPAASANMINGTFTGTVTLGNQPPPGHAHDTIEVFVGDIVTGSYALDTDTPANDSFITVINGNPFAAYLGRSFVLDANGRPLSGLFPGSTVGEIVWGPGVTDALGILHFFTPVGYQVHAQVSYSVSAPDVATTSILLSITLAGLATARRLVFKA